MCEARAQARVRATITRVLRKRTRRLAPDRAERQPELNTKYLTPSPPPETRFPMQQRRGPPLSPVDVARHRGASGGFLLDRHEASGAVAVTASRSTDTPTALGGAGKSAAARRNHIATLAAAAANSRGNPRRGFDWAQPVVDRVRQCLYRDLDRCCGAHLNGGLLSGPGTRRLPRAGPGVREGRDGPSGRPPAADDVHARQIGL